MTGAAGAPVVHGESLEDLWRAVSRFEYGPPRADGSRSVTARLPPEEALPLRRAQLRAAGDLLSASADEAQPGVGSRWTRIEQLWHDALLTVLDSVAEQRRALSA